MGEKTREQIQGQKKLQDGMLVGAQGSYHEVGVFFAKLRICGESIMLATSRIIDVGAAS